MNTSKKLTMMSLMLVIALGLAWPAMAQETISTPSLTLEQVRQQIDVAERGVAELDSWIARQTSDDARAQGHQRRAGWFERLANLRKQEGELLLAAEAETEAESEADTTSAAAPPPSVLASIPVWGWVVGGAVVLVGFVFLALRKKSGKRKGAALEREYELVPAPVPAKCDEEPAPRGSPAK